MKLTDHQQKVLLAVADGTIKDMTYNARTWVSLQNAGLVMSVPSGRYGYKQELTKAGKKLVEKIKEKANGPAVESPDHS